MSFRGRGRGGGGRGRGRGRGGRGGGSFRGRDDGPPDRVEVIGEVMHTSEGDLVAKGSSNERVPYFNTPVYLENMQKIGKLEDIFGVFNDYWFSVKLDAGAQADSFKKATPLCVAWNKILPMSRFTNPQGAKRGRGGGRGRGGRGMRGGRGRGRGRGSFRGSRGGGSFRGSRGGGSFRSSRGGGGGGFRSSRGGY